MPTSLAIAAWIVSLLFGSGGLSVILAYGRRLALAERDATNALKKAEDHDKELAATKERVAFMQSTFESIKESLSKLHMLDSLRTSVDVLSARLEDSRKDTAELKKDFKDFLVKALPVNPAQK